MHCSKFKFSIKNLYTKCDQIRMELRIWSHLLKKSLMEIFFYSDIITGAKKKTITAKILVTSQKITRNISH